MADMEMKKESTMEELELGKELAWIEDPGHAEGWPKAMAA